MYQQVNFSSEGTTLRGRHYCHGVNARPTLVMTHGTSATITMVIDAYAEAIFAAGFDVLLYDHRNLGKAEASPVRN